MGTEGWLVEAKKSTKTFTKNDLYKVVDANISSTEALNESTFDENSFSKQTAEDILKITTCDLFIYVGGESDEWVEDVLEGANNKNMTVINLLDVLGDSVKEEEVVEGMECEEEEEE